MTEEAPYQIIERFAAERATRSDRELLDELRALPPLPDEDDPWWSTASGRAPDAALLLVALSELIGERRLDEGVPLLLERASYGDFGEMMRGLRHALEAVVNPDWSRLVQHCVAALAHPRRGTRLWAADELQVLCDPNAVPALLVALDDDATRVRTTACNALARIGREHAQTRSTIEPRLRWYAERRAEYFDSERWSTEVRCAIEALGEVATPEAATLALLERWANDVSDCKTDWLREVYEQRVQAATSALTALRPQEALPPPRASAKARPPKAASPRRTSAKPHQPRIRKRRKR